MLIRDDGTLEWKISPTPWLKIGSDAGTLHASTGYVYVTLNGKKYKAHRVAWLLYHGQWPVGSVDHIDGDRTNNRKGNIREATCAQNQQNRGVDKRNVSGFTGVSWAASLGKWRARICIDYRYVSVGCYGTPEEAAAAYAKAKSELHTFQPIARAS